MTIFVQNKNNMKVTKEGIEKLGFEFIDYDAKTNTDYTFEKKSKKIKHYFCLMWQPNSNEIVLTEYERHENNNGIFRINKLYQGNPATIDELKNALIKH